MTDYYHPQTRAVLVAASRTGSGFLQSALSNHSDIGCERTAPLSPFSSYVAQIPGATSKQICRAQLFKPGYRANVFKLTYRQFRDQGGAAFIEAIEATRLIHLYRENPLRIVLSALINTRGLAGALDVEYAPHAYDMTEHDPIVVQPADFLNECDRYLANVQQMKDDLARCHLPMLTLTYEMITFDALSPEFYANRVPHGTEQLIYQFLKVSDQPLVGVTARMHPAPLSAYIVNWQELVDALAVSAYREWLERELTYEAQWNARSNSGTDRNDVPGSSQ